MAHMHVLTSIGTHRLQHTGGFGVSQQQLRWEMKSRNLCHKEQEFDKSHEAIA